MKYNKAVKTAFNLLSCLSVSLLLWSVNMSCTGQQPIDVEPFRDLARNADCADIANRLFLIDEARVFWDRQGNCPDNSFSQILFGGTPEEELCSREDSIAGPRQTCGQEEFREMFETITNNLDQSDLGLGPEHEVNPVSF